VTLKFLVFLALLTEPQAERAFLRDKILGMLVGSAIGDAMGAPSEMWTREQIQAEYGFVRDLHPRMTKPSPEGTWELNVRAGTTTDDTRWKALVIDYLAGARTGELQAKDFAAYLSTRFEAEREELRRVTMSDSTSALVRGVMRLQWLEEWVKVARAYMGGDLDEYSSALNRFYGGEMVCAGLLFAPALGAYYPGEPEAAYRNTFAVDIYDLGYAKDVSAITAAMVAAAIPEDSTPESILAVLSDVDPEGFFESRLIGRQAFNMLRDARAIVYKAREARLSAPLSEAAPAHDPWVKSGLEPIERAQLQEAYRLLDGRQQRMPFHAGEIHLVNLTALLYSDFDFRGALEFVVNYGRDNDTTAAVTGAVLGAFLGAERLPEKWVATALERNRAIGIDLDELTDRLLAAIEGHR